MCGIFGVRGHPDAVHLTQMGLYALQHRGQESVGVVSIDAAGDAVAFRRMGTMTDSMAHDMERSPGMAAIGHTRYSTSGSSTIENAQPMLARSRAENPPARATVQAARLPRDAKVEIDAIAVSG